MPTLFYIQCNCNVRNIVCTYGCRKNWSNEACIDTLRLEIRYTAAKVFRRAQKVVNYYYNNDIKTCTVDIIYSLI